MQPNELSAQLRLGKSPDLVRRRWIIGFSLVGAAMGQIVSLYQSGILRHLPDPPGCCFDADRVDASHYAYKRLQTPDGFMMTASYAVTAWLAGAGGENRGEEQPALPIAMSGKILCDLVVAGKLAQEEWAENRALCAYCQLATVCSVASAVLAVPELLKAFGRR